MEEVSLIIEEQVFTVKKDILCQYSDYFRAMFSGSYVENDKKVIAIDMVDATSMNTILRYMEMGMIDLFEFSLSNIGDLAMAANFLQITELIKQIQYTLEVKLSKNNWIDIMTIAENASYDKLEQTAAAYSLYAFKSMKPEDIPNIHKLFWYLSHPYLDTDSELEVFKFGLKWINHTETGADALMIVMGCLDLKRILPSELVEMKMLVKDYVNSLAAKVIDCLHELLAGNYELTEEAITKEKQPLVEMFTERVYIEVQNLLKESISRKPDYVPAVPLWEMKEGRPELVPHYLYKFSKESGFQKWLQVADRHLWGWCVTNWGPTKLVVVCGELGRGTGIFMREVKVYDVVKEEWNNHGVHLPLRRHGGVAVVGNMLYIVGGVGGFRVVLDTVLLYDLNQMKFKKIARLPDAIQSPAVCVHDQKVYAAGHNNIYQYENLGDTDRWVQVVGTDIRMSCMMSFRGYIYCTQNYFSYLYRFQPGVHKRLQMISCFTNPPAGICNLGNKLLFLTRTMCGHSDSLAVEEFKKYEEKPKVVWSQSAADVKVNEVAGTCRVAMSLPPVHREVSQYHRRYLMRYTVI